jgi:hypothetical protein
MNIKKIYFAPLTPHWPSKHRWHQIKCASVVTGNIIRHFSDLASVACNAIGMLKVPEKRQIHGKPITHSAKPLKTCK